MTEAQRRARRRVDALLARAERTTYPAEAEACRRKAAELVERHELGPALRRDEDREAELEALLRRWLAALVEAEEAAVAAQAAAGNVWAEAYAGQQPAQQPGAFAGNARLRQRFSPRPPPAPWQP